MTSLPLVMIVLGTRPEAIKLAPVIRSFKSNNFIKTRVVLSGQHKEMVDQVINLFGFSADQDLDLMLPGQSLTHVTCSVLKGLREEFNSYKPNLILVQGDTTTAFAAALAAFYEQIPIGHVEAGLRTENLLDPYPEEANRRMISQLANIHFAPTKLSQKNLEASGVTGKIVLTGNTVIDALLFMADRVQPFECPGLDTKKYHLILVTVHRRENWGSRLKSIAMGILKLLSMHPDVAILLPLHPNPKVRGPLRDLLSDHPRIFLSEPLEYDKLVSALKSSKLILTDSGGLQEEAPSLGKPVLVLRRTTERVEAIDHGTAILVGTEPQDIATNASRLLTNSDEYQSMSKVMNPFGDGNASKRILDHSLEFLGI